MYTFLESRLVANGQAVHMCWPALIPAFLEYLFQLLDWALIFVWLFWLYERETLKIERTLFGGYFTFL
jgi:hypothetical protein